ncbi:MAG TPA: hypothetical protein ENG81_01095 [Candidatus Bathyarchaeota archaeon]|nr:hypothetical protein [Candidatus Bathyarchaeota archaeon]
MPDTGVQSPTTTGTVSNQWNAPTDAYSSGSGQAGETTDTQAQDYGGYGFSLAGRTIDGIVVNARGEAINGVELLIELSWDNGVSWTTPVNIGYMNNPTDDHIIGGAEDDWGHSWTGAEMADGKFLVRITNDGGNGTWIDWLPVTVYWSPIAYDLPVTVGAFTLTGINALFSRGYTLACVVGEFTLTGITTILTSARSMIASVGSFTLTGITTGLIRGYTLVTTIGSYILTGVSAIFSGAGSWKTTNQSKSSSISPTNQSQSNISPTGQTKSSRSEFINHEKS